VPLFLAKLAINILLPLALKKLPKLLEKEKVKATHLMSIQNSIDKAMK